MKSLFALAIFFMSASAFANPFENFEGSYLPVGSPQVTMDQMNYCNWLNFRAMTGVKISKRATDGVEIFTLSSTQGGTGLKVASEFKEINITGPMGTSNIAVISGDANSAQYQLINTGYDGLKEVYTWNISKNQSGAYALKLVYQLRDQAGKSGACYYNVMLSMQ